LKKLQPVSGRACLKVRIAMKIASFSLALFVATSKLLAQQPIDKAYTDEIRKQTTDPQFLPELVNHLPASSIVPSPLAFNGYIAGAEGHLTYAEDVARYIPTLKKVSPRVKVISAGNSEEGKEMIAVAIPDADWMAHFDHYYGITLSTIKIHHDHTADANRLERKRPAKFTVTWIKPVAKSHLKIRGS
jgi:hypothetical protein